MIAKRLMAFILFVILYRVTRIGFALTCFFMEGLLPYGCPSHLLTALLFLAAAFPVSRTLAGRLARRKGSGEK